MSTNRSIKITYEGCGTEPRGVRVMDLETLQRFHGYDIGSRDVNHLVLRDASVCPQHVKIELTDMHTFVLIHLDGGRKDSVRLNSTWIPVGGKAELHHGDTFIIGAVVLRFEVGNFH